METHLATTNVAVAMSGGVDSSVAAARLVQQGRRVVGLTMKLYSQQSASLGSRGERGCCNQDAIYRAQAVCRTLEIPHYSLDLVDEFKKYVIDDFITEYISGRTPNPCIRCNTYLKWGVLFEKARQLDCDRLATGHYARIEFRQGEYQLRRAADADKDQVYALWGIPRQRLAQTIFPLGELTKSEVRQIAGALGLKTAHTPRARKFALSPTTTMRDFCSGKIRKSWDRWQMGR